MKIIVPQLTESIRLDAFLSDQFEDYSRSQLKKLVLDGMVKVNDAAVSKGNLKMQGGEKVEIEFPEVSSDLEPREINLNIVFEDEELLVLIKPAGLVVHPTPENVNTETTLVHGLLHYFGQDFLKVGNVFRPGIVHRLDRNTSGLLLIAKTQRAYLKLVEQFAAREVKKSYLALVLGKLKHEKATIDSPIMRDPNNYKRMIVRESSSAKPSITHYKVKEQFNGCTLVNIDLETGRTHQIRVHFSSVGHPLAGDTLYGNESANRGFLKNFGLERQFLHAHKLAFIHPVNKKELSFEAPLSDDLKSVLKQL